MRDKLVLKKLKGCSLLGSLRTMSATPLNSTLRICTSMTVHCYTGYKNNILTSWNTSTVTIQDVFSTSAKVCVSQASRSKLYMIYTVLSTLYVRLYYCLTTYRFVFIFENKIFFTDLMLIPLIRRNVACYLTSNKQLLKICAAIGNTKNIL